MSRFRSLLQASVNATKREGMPSAVRRFDWESNDVKKWLWDTMGRNPWSLRDTGLRVFLQREGDGLGLRDVLSILPISVDSIKDIFVEIIRILVHGWISRALSNHKLSTALAWNVEDLMPPSEKFVFNFNSKEELKRWHLYSDSEYGGLSSASLEIADAGAGLSGIFSGNLSLDVSEGSTWRMNRSGFCGMRSKKIDGFIDLDAYDIIAMKLRGDGRCYISTIYTENWVNSPGQQEDNSWQAFVFVPKDKWFVAKIPLEQYLPTWRGNVIDAKLEMNPARIVGMSFSVNAEGGIPGAKSGPGDFRLELDWIKALRT